MASKKTKAAAAGDKRDDDLDELFSGIGDDSKSKKPSAPKSSKAATSGSKPKNDDDLLADLESELTSQQTSSRPHTPRLSKDVKRPLPPSAAAADATARKSTDSARSLNKASLTPSATSSELHEAEKKAPAAEPAQQAEQLADGSGGGWWGGWISTATATANAAMKQAEAAYKEIQQNEEAKKWADQVKGLRTIDVGALQKYGWLI